jgi:threonine/homoserine/homoserine lactone efflux protein
VHLDLWLAFVAASTALLVLPGPTILTVISYSVSHGRRANVPLVAAVALGDSTALLLSLVVFFVAFLPQFLSTSAPVPPQLWILAATFVVLATINASLYAAFASAARRLLESPRAQRRFNLLGGSLISVAGVWALLAKSPAR